jgi:type VI secretion system protein ImpL
VAAPFLQQRKRKGYIARRVDKKSIDWSESFLSFINNAYDGRNIVAGEFDVKIDALPTGINQSAKISPYATFIDLHCAKGVQTLANYNYSASNTFKWSLAECGDVTLRIEVGEFSLRKNYEGQKGFPEFLADFRDGRRIFRVSEFKEFTKALQNESVSAIDVNYQFTGQRPVVSMIRSVPLQAPPTAAACWTSE